MVRPYRGVPWQEQPRPASTKGALFAQAQALRFQLVRYREAVDFEGRSQLISESPADAPVWDALARAKLVDGPA
eukprot:13500090-Alexandrium_andersonii.AAC.1